MSDNLTILAGDVRETLKTRPNKSVHCCITSPPYWGLRDYGCNGQIGLEKTPAEYIAEMVKVFREVRRVLRDDGTVWLNLGSSYAGSGKSGGGSYEADGMTASAGVSCGKPPTQSHAGALTSFYCMIKSLVFKPKDEINIPFFVATALQADGWHLRQTIVWHKPAPMPESVTDRCTKAHEYLFLLTKNPRYYYDAEAIKEESEYPDDDRKARVNGDAKSLPTELQAGMRAGSETYPTRNKRSVWTIAREGFNGVVSYGRHRITSADCAIHGCPACHVHAQQCDGQPIGLCSSHSPGSDGDRDPRLQDVSDAIISSRSEFRAGVSSARGHSNGNCRTAGELERGGIFYDRAFFHTECTGPIHHFCAKCGHRHESKISEDAESCAIRLGLPAQTLGHTEGIFSSCNISENCSCYYGGKTQKRQDHFAVFPRKLVEPCILAGTSAKGCCAKCGAPWRRVTESVRRETRPGENGKLQSVPGGWATSGSDHSAIGHSTEANHSKIVGNREPQRHVTETQTVGWEASCRCGAEVVPCVILDPFGGSGTVAEVAIVAGRRAVLCELNPAYVELIRQRLASACPLLC